MLETVVVRLVMLWLLALVTRTSLGGFVHSLRVLAAVLMLARTNRRRHHHRRRCL